MCAALSDRCVRTKAGAPWAHTCMQDWQLIQQGIAEMPVLGKHFAVAWAEVLYAKCQAVIHHQIRCYEGCANHAANASRVSLNEAEIGALEEQPPSAFAWPYLTKAA
jgi:hypothetical protein